MDIRGLRGLILGGVALALAHGEVCRAGFVFKQTNLVSSVPGTAAHTDANLKNPWGISYSPTGPFWVSNQGTGTSTLYNGDGEPFPLVVTVQSLGVPSGPTGQVFNSTTGFELSPGGNRAIFLFANLNGTISGWNPAESATSAVVKVMDSAVFTGLALGTSAAGSFLYAADNAGGGIRVFDSAFATTSLVGSFVDPGLPSGFLCAQHPEHRGHALCDLRERNDGRRRRECVRFGREFPPARSRRTAREVRSMIRGEWPSCRQVSDCSAERCWWATTGTGTSARLIR